MLRIFQKTHVRLMALNCPGLFCGGFLTLGLRLYANCLQGPEQFEELGIRASTDTMWERKRKEKPMSSSTIIRVRARLTSSSVIHESAKHVLVFGWNAGSTPRRGDEKKFRILEVYSERAIFETQLTLRQLKSNNTI